MSLNRLATLFASRISDGLAEGEKIALFLGAGADIASGGLSFNQLKRAAVKDYGAGGLTSAASDDLIDQKFQEIFASIDTPSERARLINTIFRRNNDLSPSDAYRMIVLLAQQGAIDVIVTTNFDTMLEAAQDEMGITAIQTFAIGLARPFPLDAATRKKHDVQHLDSDRVPYIKMHGCISTRAVTHITADELKNPKYDASLIRLLKERLKNAHIVFLGYGGYDFGLAEAVSKSFSKESASLYFCNPSLPDPEAPLVRAAGGVKNFISVETTFTEAVEYMAKPVLQRPQVSPLERVFIERLFRWRVDFASGTYRKDHLGLTVHGKEPEIVRRTTVESALDTFLLSKKPLAVVVGQSGFGKSTLGTSLKDRWASDDTQVLLTEVNSFVGPAFEDEILNKIDGYQIHAGSGLQYLEGILRKRSKRLIIYLDGINEFDADIENCARFFKSVLRFCNYADDSSPIRIIATVRTDSWAALQNRVNENDLRRAMWSPAGTPGAVIVLDKLSDTEFDDALARVNRIFGASYQRERMSSAADELLRDPFFLSIAAQEKLDSVILASSSQAMDQLLRSKIKRGRVSRSGDEIFQMLGSVAFEAFDKGRDALDVKILNDNSLDPWLVTALKDASIFTDARHGDIRFAHDRIHEFFLSQGLERASGLSISSADDLKRSILDFEHSLKASRALSLLMLRNADTMMSIIDSALAMASGLLHCEWAVIEREKVLAFCLRYLSELAVDQPEKLATRFIEVAEDLKITGRDETLHLRHYLQAAAFLPPETAVATLPAAERAASPTSPVVVEANTHTVDKFVEILLARSGRCTDLLAEAPFAGYFADPSIELYRRIGRILGLASQLGPDNQHPEEYAASKSSLMAALSETLKAGVPDHQITATANFIGNGRDRYLFNASEHGIESFFKNKNRNDFLSIWTKLAGGECIEADDFEVLKPYLETLDHDLEFQLGNFIFIISALNDFDKTVAVWKELFASLDNESPPNQIDFLQAVVTYIYLIPNKEYDDLLRDPIDRVLIEMPRVVTFQPGADRGLHRGYVDPHDQIFEDGFNPVANYCYLLPSFYRRSVRWSEYVRTEWEKRKHPAPIFDKHLARFMDDMNDQAAITIIHALGQFCILWPREGLLTLRPLLGSSNARIRRSVLRVLAETYSRSPIETEKFLSSSGSAISELEIRTVKIADGNIGRRQFEGVQWARVLHLLLQFPDAKAKLLDALMIAYKAPSLQEALRDIAAMLKLNP